jgi:hypothetical protein
MKRVYFGYNPLVNRYFFSECPLDRVQQRKEFESYSSLVSFLGCPDLNKLRKRKNLQIIASGFDKPLLEKLKSDVQLRGFKSNDFAEE